jgi:hypothetical protein
VTAARLRLDRDDLAALALDRDAAFREALVAHMRKTFPEQARALGDERLRDTIARGLTRARAHGLIEQADSGRYVACTFVFGLEFEDKPEHAWARAILARDESASRRAAELVETSLRYIRTFERPERARPGRRRA